MKCSGENIKSMMTHTARHLLLSAIAALFFAATLAGNWTSVRDSAIRAARDWTSWSDRGFKGQLIDIVSLA